MGRRAGRILLAVAVGALLLLFLGRVAVGFYTEILWYDALGYLSTLWRRVGLGLTVRGSGAVLAAGLVFGNLWWVARYLGPVRVRRVYGNIEIAERVPRRYMVLGGGLIAVLSGWWLADLQFGDDAVLTLVSWLLHVPWGVTDALFGRDVAFYVFGLPVLANVLSFLLLVLVWVLALVALGHVLVGGIRLSDNRLSVSGAALRHLAVLVAALVVLLGVRYWLGRYFLVIEGHGVSGSLGYTDVEARLPVYWVMMLVAVAAAGTVVYGAWRRSLYPPVFGLGALLVGGVLLTGAYPALVQKFQVEPNELSRETPYIQWNMDFTRRAYGLDALEREAIPYRRSARPGPDQLEALLTQFPVWDQEPLQRTFNEIQTLFPYYWFPDVDYDRYGLPGRKVQVGIGVREFRPEGLGAGARTWQSLHLNPSYIRGLGAVIAPARPVDGSGAPDLWVRNINPVVSDPAAPAVLALSRPSVFFGETMTDYAVVVPGRDNAFTGEPGVDFPEGIPLSSLFRVLAFAWRFGDENLLFSGEVSRSSRVLIRRSIRERVEELAPFILWDTNALPVVQDHAIVWMLDGYTTAASFPLSRPISLGRRSVRYLRNSVKAVVHGITGDVTLYAMDDDPILAAYRRVFPELVQPLDRMPMQLTQHLRYPELALLAQAEILQEYHVERVEGFYAGQDVWQRPQGTAPNGGVREYRPLYALMPLPGGGVAYRVVLPFIARARQNMTAVLIARNDVDGYGALTLYEFPRDQQIPGPGQVQAVIEQDAEISPELSLLRQRGSGVDVGQLRVVPLDSAVLYIQPLFLSADQNAIPELSRVVVSDGENVSMARTLPAALAGLQGGAAPVEETAMPERTSWPGEALDLLNRAEASLRAGDWEGYGRLLEELRGLLERINREDTGQSP